MAGSKRADTNKYSLELLPPVCASFHWTITSPTSAGDSPVPVGRSGPCSYEVTSFFPLVLLSGDLACTLQEWSFVSPIPVKFLWSNPTDQMLWGLLLPMPDTQAGKRDVGLKTFTPMGKHLWYNYFPVYGLPTEQVEDFIFLQLHPSYHLIVVSLLSLGAEYLFFFI